jgi:hypothetical protein
MGNITMSKKERIQLVIFEKLKNGEITRPEAALRLQITPKWLRNKFKRYIECGDQGLVHKSRGKKSPRRWSEKEKDRAIELLSTDWKGFGPTFTAEKLKELYGIEVSRETLRNVMIEAKVWEKRSSRPKHRKRRERRAMFGQLVQLDGSPHDWLEGRGPSCSLLVFIDDATSNILWLAFAESENLIGVMKATKSYISTFGRPHEFYVDFGSVFSVNLNNEECIKKTQWERAVEELGIKIIHAHSPQAKGRVERCNGTLQDRLIKDMRLAGISSIEAANKFILETSYIAQYNTRFGVSPKIKEDAHMPIDRYDLATVFQIREERTLTNDFTIMYEKRTYQLDDKQPTIIRPKNKITVNTSLDGKITLSIRRVPLKFYEIDRRAKKIIPEKSVTNKTFKPGENSRRWVSGLSPISTKEESRMKLAIPAIEEQKRN